MKKISILLCICILATMAFTGCKKSDVTDINSGVLLYFWHNDYAGSTYREFSDEDLKELT